MRMREKLDSLLRILNIPLVEEWGEATSESNPYRYWSGLELISQETLERVLSGVAVLEDNSIVRRYFARVDRVWPPRWYRGEPVVDVGSGFGHLTLWLVLSGAGEVHAVGDPDRVGFVMRLASAAADRGLLPRGRIRSRGEFVGVGDRTLSRSLAPGAAALVLLNDTLEHVSPKARPWLFRASYTDLREGGRLVCRQHNTSSPRALARATELWDRQEEARLLPLRAAMLAELAPELDDETTQRLARATKGADREDLEEVVRSVHIGQGQSLSRPYLGAVNPMTGELLEGRTDIPEILEGLRTAGFDARVYPEMMASRRSRWLQGLAKAWPAPFLRFHLFDDVSVFEAIKRRGTR